MDYKNGTIIQRDSLYCTFLGFGNLLHGLKHNLSLHLVKLQISHTNISNSYLKYSIPEERNWTYIKNCLLMLTPNLASENIIWYLLLFCERQKATGTQFIHPQSSTPVILPCRYLFARLESPGNYSLSSYEKPRLFLFFFISFLGLLYPLFFGGGEATAACSLQDR